MRLRQFIIITLASLALPGLSSCKKWLDVNPRTQIREEEQFSSQQGFTEALFGVYQLLADTGSYGKNLSYSFLDVLAQRYENKSSSTNNVYGQIARYNYLATLPTNVPAITESIWRTQYRAIAQANLILKNVDGKKSVLTEQAYAIIKGEALAIRGMLHFDLLRMYAPAYLEGANAQVPAIPYLEDFTVEPQAKLTMNAVLDKCIADLKAADEILSVYPEIDQIATNQGATSLELLTMYRQNHLNSWAVKGLLARLYLYRNEKALALEYAKKVIDSGKFRFILSTEINADATNVASDLTFSREHIFSVNVSNLKVYADIFLKNTSTTGGEAADLFTTLTKLNNMYESSVPGYGTDVRRFDAPQNMWFRLNDGVIYSKKYYSDNVNNVKQRLIPVLRLPEMYYIAAEAAPATADGYTYLNEVRKARLLPELATTGTADQLNAELLKEYRKEFVGEGQLWFYYKRRNTVTIPDGVGNPMNPTKYVFPLPNAEIEFGK
ncbi:RagB/SusD family nutrient uptake outer membrane protein [Parasegetibacter sp. NRK P23]|uniref:RagB/SusD family nutrient uptake outer membrane protein n=1 Tax=Parasegetibacter sp. NRK P23 TaxID=2942999 RepID=UPI0020435E1F|nr:RagB/SusD family nutrient uptake outer membrane protein [Parasegetibacter sp. NRK P23]MCM5528935.1 RagB/SusD family nutrient uptake outer membrane protein [Parasegetibacter sp. NRK P23]